MVVQRDYLVEFRDINTFWSLHKVLAKRVNPGEIPDLRLARDSNISIRSDAVAAYEQSNMLVISNISSSSELIDRWCR